MVLNDGMKVSPSNLHQLRHLATSILKDKEIIGLAQHQRFLGYDHQKIAEINSGHIARWVREGVDGLPGRCLAMGDTLSQRLRILNPYFIEMLCENLITKIRLYSVLMTPRFPTVVGFQFSLPF